MTKNRLEAFSDAVIAIIITIMVLELRPPHELTFEALQPLWAVFAAYVLSFVNLGTWWSNHHHLLYAARHINGAVIWANLHLLFWLSLYPFVTSSLGETHFAPLAVAAYGVVSLMAGIGYSVLQRTLIAADGEGSALAKAIGSDFKGYFSLAAYAAGIASAFVLNWVAIGLYILVVVVWLVPDRRIEKRVVS